MILDERTGNRADEPAGNGFAGATRSSTMRRRTVLFGSASLLVLLAGCIDDVADGGSSDDDGDGYVDGVGDTDDETDADGEDGQGDQGVVREMNIEIHSVDTGDVEESASVSIEGQTVRVTGTIRGANTCYTARIDEVNVEDSTLFVAIESYEDVEEGEGCRDAEVGIEYEAVVEVDGDPPSTVRVEHDGEEIEATERS